MKPPFILRLIGGAIVVAAALVILALLFLALPGTDGWLVRVVYAAFAVLAFVLLRERVGWLALALVVLAVIPPAVSLVIGLRSYVGLDSASYAEEEWKVRSLPEGRRPLIVHLSDPHFIGKADGKTYEGDEWKIGVLDETAAKIIELKPKFVIVSGDITDRGTAAEWEQAEETLLSPLAKAGIELILAPGNHDLQPFFIEPTKGPPASRSGRQMSAYLKVAARYATGLQTSDGSPFERRMGWIPPSEEEIEKITQQWLQCSMGCPSEGIRGCSYGCNQWLDRQVLSFEKHVEVEDACGAWYPMVRLDKDSGAVFIVLCSNRRLVETAGTNAIGELGDKQIEGLRKSLNSLPTDVRHVFVVLHHTVVKRPGERWGLPTRWDQRGIFDSSAFEFATLPNRLPESLEVVRILQSMAAAHPKIRVHLAFGHRHAAFLGKIDQKDELAGRPWVWVSEAPAAYDPEGGIWIGYDSPDNKWMKWRWWNAGQ